MQTSTIERRSGIQTPAALGSAEEAGTAHSPAERNFNGIQLTALVGVQQGVIAVQQALTALIEQRGPNAACPVQRAAQEITDGAVAILKGAIDFQSASRRVLLYAASSHGNGHLSPTTADGVDSDSARSDTVFSPENAAAQKELGDALLNDGQPLAAIDAYVAALRLNPRHTEAENNLAVALLNTGGYDRADPILRRIFTREFGLPPDKAKCFEPSIPFNSPCKSLAAAPFKLLDRIEQLSYLIDRQLIDGSFRELVNRYKTLHDELSSQPGRAPYSPLTPVQVDALGGYFDKSLYFAPPPRLAGPTMSDANDYAALEDQYLEQRAIFFDDFLSPDALEQLRRFFLESTVFSRYSEAGFVASYVTEGFTSGLIYQIIEELHARFPRILQGKHLNNMWCYRYCSHGAGVRPHNGDGSVTINFYLTPDIANLDATGGGMVMYDKVHPAEWDWLTYNMHKDDPAIQADIAEYLSDARAEKIPYKCNRAVLFHSTLFHKTDPYHFADGYLNRRMNITMLFGKRGQESALLR